MEIQTVRQMIEVLRQKLGALGFLMTFLSFHPADSRPAGEEQARLVINLAGYREDRALIVGVYFYGGPDGVSWHKPHFYLFGEFLPTNPTMLPGLLYQELEPYGDPFALIPDFSLRITENEIADEDLSAYLEKVFQNLETFLTKFGERLAPRFTVELHHFFGFVPRYSDERQRRHIAQEEQLWQLGRNYADSPYIWAALQCFPEGYIKYDPRAKRFK